MVGVEIPARTYAVFAANDVPDLHRVFEHGHREWLPKSVEHEGLDGPWLEVHPETYPEDRIIYVYNPVRRVSGG